MVRVSDEPWVGHLENVASVVTHVVNEAVVAALHVGRAGVVCTERTAGGGRTGGNGAPPVIWVSVLPK